MKKFLSIVLTICMAFSVLTVGAVSASAAENANALEAGSVIYFDNTYTKWSKVYFYAWKYGFFGDTYEMDEIDGTNLYKIVVPVDVPANNSDYFLFKNTGAGDWTGRKTDDQKAYAEYNTYTPLYSSGSSVALSYTDRPIEPEIIATPCGKEFVDSLDVTVYAFNTTASTYTIDNGEPIVFENSVSFTITSTTKVTVAAGMKRFVYNYKKVNDAIVTVYTTNYTGNVYMYSFGGDRVGDEFVLMNNEGNGKYTAYINGSAQVIFTTTNSWRTARKFIIYENGVRLSNQEPLISFGESRTFDLK